MGGGRGLFGLVRTMMTVGPVVSDDDRILFFLIAKEKRIPDCQPKFCFRFLDLTPGNPKTKNYRK